MTPILMCSTKLLAAPRFLCIMSGESAITCFLTTCLVQFVISFNMEAQATMRNPNHHGSQSVNQQLPEKNGIQRDVEMTARLDELLKRKEYRGKPDCRSLNQLTWRHTRVACVGSFI